MKKFILRLTRRTNGAAASSFVHSKTEAQAFWKAWDKWGKWYEIQRVVDIATKDKDKQYHVRCYKEYTSLGTLK